MYVWSDFDPPSPLAVDRTDEFRSDKELLHDDGALDAAVAANLDARRANASFYPLAQVLALQKMREADGEGMKSGYLLGNKTDWDSMTSLGQVERSGRETTAELSC